jgi:hypothetical protein
MVQAGSALLRPVNAMSIEPCSGKCSIRTNLVWRNRLDGCEVNIVFLNNAGVQRVEVHNKDKFVVQLSLGFEHKATFVLILIIFVLILGALSSAVLRRDICFMSFRVLLGRNSGLFSPSLVRDDIFEFVELMQKDVLVPFCSPTVEGFVPSLRLNNTDHDIEKSFSPRVTSKIC